MRALFWEPEAFFSFPQNDPDKEYNMPKDGTVHELTSNVGATQTLLVRWDKELSSSDTAGQHQWEPTLRPASSTQALSGSQSPEIALDFLVALVTVKTPGTRPARWLGRVCRKPLPWAYPRPSRCVLSTRPSFSYNSFWTFRKRQVPCWPLKVHNTRLGLACALPPPLACGHRVRPLGGP